MATKPHIPFKPGSRGKDLRCFHHSIVLCILLKIVLNLKLSRPNFPQFSSYYDVCCVRRNTINEASFFIKVEGLCNISESLMIFWPVHEFRSMGGKSLM